MPTRDRIKQLRRVRARELRPHPLNWRTHPAGQRHALRAVLHEIGYADALLARELPDGTLELIDGHLRAEITPDEHVPVLVLDLDEQEANKLLAVHDPLTEMAETDGRQLGELVSQIETDSDGFGEFLASLAESKGDAPPPRPADGPDIEVPEAFQLLVECRDEEDQRQLYARLADEGYACRVLTL